MEYATPDNNNNSSLGLVDSLESDKNRGVGKAGKRTCTGHAKVNPHNNLWDPIV